MICSKSVKSQCCPLQPDTSVMDGGGCLCFFVLPVMVTGKPQRPPLCVFTQPCISHRVCLSSLPRPLGSATVHTNRSFRNTHCISLLLPAEGSTSANLILPLFRLSLTVNSGPRDPGCILGTNSALLPSHLPRFLLLAHLQLFQYSDLSDVFVEQEILC